MTSLQHTIFFAFLKVGPSSVFAHLYLVIPSFRLALTLAFSTFLFVCFCFKRDDALLKVIRTRCFCFGKCSVYGFLLSRSSINRVARMERAVLNL